MYLSDAKTAFNKDSVTSSLLNLLQRESTGI